VGRFPQELYDAAMKRGWVVISMKQDWKRIFAFEKQAADSPLVQWAGQAFVPYLGPSWESAPTTHWERNA
jgi:hypothetical protein